MPGKPVVIPLKPDQLAYTEMRQALEAVNLIKEKKGWDHQGKNLRNGITQKIYFK